MPGNISQVKSVLHELLLAECVPDVATDDLPSCWGTPPIQDFGSSIFLLPGRSMYDSWKGQTGKICNLMSTVRPKS